MANKTIDFRCIPVEQPIGTFYIGAINAEHLVAISFADVRRPDGRDIERYIGTQRDLSEGRVAEIKDYVKTVDACFPSGIILAIDSENAHYDKEKGILSVTRDDRVAKIIDGQHRIAGLEGYNGPTFQLNVTIFIDMDLEDQSMVFSVINLKQTKVSKSLAYDLYEHAKARSPQKTCHNIAKLMNFREDSPLRGRIKILGKASGSGMEVITQATFVDRIMRLITRHPMEDRDRLKRGRSIERVPGKRGETLIFRDMFIDGEDAKVARVLWNYFKAIEERWPMGWNNLDRGYVLARTTGFSALVRLLPEVWNEIGLSQNPPSVSVFLEFFRRSNLNDTDFTTDNYKPGSSGEGELLRALRMDIIKK